MAGGPVECPSCYVWCEKEQTGEGELAEVAESGQVVNPCGKEKFGTVSAVNLGSFSKRAALKDQELS